MVVLVISLFSDAQQHAWLAGAVVYVYHRDFYGPPVRGPLIINVYVLSKPYLHQHLLNKAKSGHISLK